MIIKGQNAINLCKIKYMNDDQTKKVLNHTPIHHLIDDANSQDNTNKQTMRITKEGEPIEINAEKIIPQEVEIVDTEPRIEDREVEKFVEVNQEEPSIHPELKKAGLQTIDNTSLDPKHKVELPLSDEKVMEGLHKPITSSYRWLAEFAFFMLKQAHLSLKKVHGHVVRVMQR